MITRVLSSESLSKNPAGEKPILKKGEVLRGQVALDYGKGEVLIQSRGSTFRAFTSLGVKEGEQYDFRVSIPPAKNSLPVLEVATAKASSAKPEKRLEPISGLLSEISLAPRSRGSGGRTSALLKNISRSLPAFIYRNQGGDQSAWMSRFLADGGLFWERKVARFLTKGMREAWRGKLGNDLKGMLLELQSSLKSERQDVSEVSSISRRVDEAIDFIQKMQLENRDFLREGVCYFVVPGKSEDGFRQGELYLRRAKRDKEIRFSMSLDFSRLGLVEVISSIQEPAISARFNVEDEKQAEFIRENLPRLEAALREKGFIPGQLVCLSGATAPEKDTLPRSGSRSDSVNLMI